MSIEMLSRLANAFKFSKYLYKGLEINDYGTREKQVISVKNGQNRKGDCI